jgi:hypothetical protein
MRRLIAVFRAAACRTTVVFWRRACTLRHGLMLAIADPYRPERHYMRGPGPKYRERRGHEQVG